MSIKFICSCGKHLRARDESAARRARCPRCGEPVGIPSLQPTHAGTTAAPMTPQERRRRNRLAGRPDDPAVATALPPPLAPLNVAPDAAGLPPRRLRVSRQVETHWYQCLAYPFFCGRVLSALTMSLSLLTACIALLMPSLYVPAEMTALAWLPYLSFLLPPLAVLVYAGATVDCALTSALAGRGPGPYWPGRYVGSALRSAGRWLFCFLAGPVVPAVAAGYYWLYGGDLKALDWIVLVELVALAVGYWLLAVVRTAESGRLRDANPVAVARFAHRLGLRAAVPVLVAPAFAFGFLLHTLFALSALHQKPLGGLLLLILGWGNGLFVAACLFRLLGVWCYRKV